MVAGAREMRMVRMIPKDCSVTARLSAAARVVLPCLAGPACQPVARHPSQPGASQRACAGDAQRCRDLDLRYERGIVAADVAILAQLYRKSCDAGTTAGCYSLGVLYTRGTGVARDPAQAAALYRRTCDRGILAACN